MGVTSPDQIADGASGGRFLSGDDKQAMYHAKEPFYIVGAEPFVETRFEKPQTYFYALRKLPDGTKEQRILPLTHSPFRQRLAEAIVVDTAAGNVSGPWYLDKFRTSAGNDAWNLATKPPETAADAPAMTNTAEVLAAAEPAAANTSYEDLPF